jgi:hypothetical protein
MPLQSAKNVVVNFKLESAFNTAPGASGATQLRYVPSAGLNLQAATIRSGEARADALQTMGRNGSLQVTGSYGAEASVGSHDTILEALMRSTWVPAVVITQATAGLTSITTTTSTIVAAAGSWITAGVRVGDVVTLTQHATAANNNLRLRVKAVTALTLTVQGTPLTVDAVADTSFTLTIGKKLKNPASPTKRTFYIEQNNTDIDASQVFGGCRFVGFTLTGSPDGVAALEFQVLGASMATLTGASAPYYTSPTTFNATPLVFADAFINVGGTDIAIATAFELSYTINAATQPVIGSQVSPDVFDNDVSMTGSFSLIREDFDFLTSFVAETEFELHILLREPEAAPQDYISFFVPRIKFTGIDAQLGGDGAMIESAPFQTGAKEATGGYDATLLTICTSAA